MYNVRSNLHQLIICLGGEGFQYPAIFRLYDFFGLWVYHPSAPILMMMMMMMTTLNLLKLEENT